MGIFDRNGDYVTAEDVLDDEELAEYYEQQRNRPRKRHTTRPKEHPDG